MKEARIMKENITYYLVWITCWLAGCAPTPKQIEDTTDPIPMYPDYTDIMIPPISHFSQLLIEKRCGRYASNLERGIKRDTIIFREESYFPFKPMGKPFRAGSGQPPANNRSRPMKGKWFCHPLSTGKWFRRNWIVI